MRSEELWLAQENHATVKLYFAWNENLQRKQNWETKSISTNLKKILDKTSQFLSSEQPSEPKSVDVLPGLTISEVENTLGKPAIAVNLEAIRFEFWTGRSVNDSGNLCPLWSVILKSV